MKIEDKKTGKTRIARGIFSLHDDTLKYCIATPGKPRPKSFESHKGDGHTLVVMKRLKENVPLLMFGPLDEHARFVQFLDGYDFDLLIRAIESESDSR
jgi:hypothetical protein